MATQSAGNPAARNTQSAAGVKGNVKLASHAPNIGRNIEQPLVGKQTDNGGQSMPGSKGKGQAVTTVKSNPIQGKNVQGNTSFGNGSIINGVI